MNEQQIKDRLNFRISQYQLGYSDYNNHIRIDNMDDMYYMGQNSARQAYLHTIFSKLESFLMLPENWDGYNSDRIQYQVVNNAINLLHNIVKHKTKLYVFPCCNGHVQIEWSCNNIELELEIKPTTYDAYFEDLISGTTWISEFELNDTDQISKIIEQL